MLSKLTLQQQSKLYTELENTACPIHGYLYQSVCYEPSCVDANKCYLCLDCLDEHPSQHKYLPLSYLFSDNLLRELKEYKCKIEVDILKCQQKNLTTIRLIEEIYDNIKTEILDLLQESCKKVKNLFISYLPEISTLDTFDKDLADFTYENIASSDEMKVYVKKFGTKLRQFREMRKEQMLQTASVTDEITQNIIDNTKRRVTSLHDLIKKFINNHIDIKELAKKDPSGFELEIENRNHLSSKDIQSLKVINTFTTNHTKGLYVLKNHTIEQ